MSEPVHLCAPASPDVALCGEATSGAAGPRSTTEQNGVCASCVDAMASRTIPWPPSEELHRSIRLAISDPGAWFKREPGESVANWAARAVLSVIGGEADPLITDHGFLPVKGHPDDDECTHRADGTDLSYCGESRDAHEH